MKDKLASYRNPDNNIFHISFSRLRELGYKQRKFISSNIKDRPHAEPGDLLCGTNKAQDLWIELGEKAAKNIDPGLFLVYHK